MKVRYLNLAVNDPLLEKELLDSVAKVLRHGQFILGPEVETFEKRIAEYCTRKYAIGVSSGTDALYMALRALDIGPGDEVVTTPLSWIATLNAIFLSGATPVFADIDSDLNINPEMIINAITPSTKAIIPVHYTGQICSMDQIVNIAQDHNIALIEDAAQAFGALYKKQKAGSFGQIACLSMNSMKVYHSYGEAGAVLCDDDDMANKLKSIRYAGTVNREDCHYPSLNFRMHTLQAALLLVEFERVRWIIERRREIAKRYNESLSGIIECPIENPNASHVYYTYTIRTERRDELKNYLSEKGIETKIHHPILMPYHTAYRGKYKLHIPKAEEFVRQILSIPNHEKMEDAEIEYVISTIRKFYNNPEKCNSLD